ncbi:MAG: general secretion pathway protein GspE [Planctomycetes bacterium RBG_16_64_10]|nr:MAG: general secretion pathway protein GspE [Planctomycetes bacterium RBG_16_64_10]
MKQDQTPLLDGPLDAQQMRLASQAQAADGSLARVAGQLGFATEEEALKAVGQALGLDYVDLATSQIDLSLLEGFPVKLIHRHAIFPLYRDPQSGSLVVATGNPFDLHAVDDVGTATGLSIVPVLTAPGELAKLIKTHLGVGAETIDGLLALRDSRDERVQVLDELEWDHSEDSEMAQEASVVRLVNEILTEAVEARASDIHLEAQAAGMRIRYRVDGVLQVQPAPPEINHFQAAIISRLKIMSRLNIAEKRVPQDGRIKLRVTGREIDIRVSIIPMLYGEGVVMRLLDKERMEFSLRGVGMGGEAYTRFRALIQLPHGIVLVTGPTGSGKTTTLYSALNEIKSDETKIITTEDPIEYQLDGINQIQVHTKVGLTFATSLRSILRHDPEVVLVGEIRDLETAENAVQASLTGHLVFSTLHTNDAAGAFMRLIDMGVEPYLVSSTVEGVMAQRLVRCLCPECRAVWVPAEDGLPPDFPLDESRAAETALYRAVGCRHCRGSGYLGRTGLYELLTTNDEIRHLAVERAGSHVIKKAAVAAGMRTLRQDGWSKVLAGQTTVDEVIRVTRAD